MYQFKQLTLVFLLQMLGMVLYGQSPTLTLSPPVEGFIGEQVCFPVTFQNTGPVGYGPYTRLILPPGFTFNSATFSASALTTQNLGTIVAAAPNNYVLDPVMVANGVPEAADTIFAPQNSRVILLQYPVGSLVDGGVNMIAQVCVTVPNTPPSGVGVPVPICVRGVYQYGNTPTGTNGAIVAPAVCQNITPILYRFEKLGLQTRTPGLCHQYTYQLNANIAAAGTLNGPITFTDVLPPYIQYVAGSLAMPAGCVTTTIPSSVTPGGTLAITCSGAFSGSTAAVDMQVRYNAYPVDSLNEAICDTRLYRNNASMNVPSAPPIRRDTVETRIQHVILAHNNNSGGFVSVGQTIGYTINFDITEYTAGLNAARIQFVVPDGMQYQPASLNWAGSPVSAANVTVTAGPGTGSTVVVNVHAQNAANISPCASPSLTYNATILQNYSTTRPVLSRDDLNHTSNLTYNLLEGATNCTTGASSPITIFPISFDKSIINAPTNPNGRWWPGDTIRYQLRLQIPSRDLDNVVITDFLPLPIHQVADLPATFGTMVRFHPSSAWTTPPITYTRNIAQNALIMDFGDLTDNGNGNSVDVILIVEAPIATLPYADGLFHSNFMQVRSDNSVVDNVITNQLTVVQVSAPSLQITKGITATNNTAATISPVTNPPNGNASGNDANDSMRYTITVRNVGTAPGYSLQIRDIAPSNLTNCNLIPTLPVVTGVGTAVPFTGGFSGNNLTINITDSISYAAGPQQRDIISVTYVCQVIPNVPLGTSFTNTAAVDWASAPGGVRFPQVTDQASVNIAQPTVLKSVVRIRPGYQPIASNRATIGEVIQYQVRLVIPEGTLSNFRMNDLLDQGLAFVGIDSIVPRNTTGAANITTSIGSFAAVQSGATISSPSAAAQDQDRRLDLNFGTLTNLDTDNRRDTIFIYYSTIVINHPINVNGQTRRNRATLTWTNPNNPAATQTTNVQANAITIAEPQVVLTKTITPANVLPGRSSFVTLRVESPVSATSPSFNVQLIDALPAGMNFVAGFSAGGTARVTTAPNAVGNTITASWDTINPGQSYTITFEIQASSGITPCLTLQNCASVTWQSIARVHNGTLPPAFSSTLGTMRTGNPGDPGTTANTYNRASCAPLNVVIDGSFDPFITANTPICEGGQAILQVRQYNGNIVRYRWTGPGVPAGFNNFQLIIDPVRAQDTGIYYVIVELDGCTTDTSNFFRLQLRPRPNTPNIRPLNPIVCEGSSLSFATDSVATRYVWSGPNGFTGNSATPPIINPVTLASAGTYSLFTENSSGCASNVVQSTVTVRPRPARPSINGSSPICSGTNITITTASTATSYRWTAPNGRDTTTTIRTLTVLPASQFYLSGNWTLTLIDANGCASEPAPNLPIIINTTPTTPLASNNSPICQGETAFLQATSLNATSYEWYNNAALTNLISTQQNPAVNNLNPVGSPYTFFVRAVSNGCASGVSSTTVTVQSNPATPTPTAGSICIGDTLRLFANTVAATYTWSGPAGFSSNVANPVIPNAQAINAGSYTVTVTTAADCPAVGIVQVSIRPRPATPDILGNTNYCETQTITLNSNINYTGTQVVYNWRTPTGSVTTSVPSLVINNVTAANNGGYSLNVNVDGCISLTDSLRLSVFANPATPAIAASATTVCEGGVLTFSTTTTAASYLWSGPAGFSSTLQNPNPINPVTAANAGVYTLRVTSAQGCSSTLASVTVTTVSRPTRPNITATPANVCQGTAFTLGTSATGTSFIITAPNGLDTTVAAMPISILATSRFYQQGNFVIRTTNAAGCVSDASLPVQISINANPAQAAAFSTSPICVGGSSQLSTAAVNGATYSWYSNAALTNLVSTQQNPVINNITATTTYFLQLNVNGCTSTAASTTVTVTPQPAAPAIAASATTVCEGGVLTFSTTTTAASYLWSGPNGFNSTLQTPPAISPITAADAGVYTLRVTNAQGCASAIASITITTVSRPTRPNITAIPANVCQGTAFSLGTSAAGTSFIITAPNGLDTTVAAMPISILATSRFYQNGNFVIRTTNAAGCISDASLPVQITINANPAQAAAFSTSPICVGGSSQLSTAAVNGATYSWYSNAALTNLVSTQQNPVINNITATTTYFLQLNVNGCTSTAASTTVTVTPQPAAPAIAASATTVCEGGVLTFSTTTTAASYLWSGPNGFSSTLQNPAVINPVQNASAGVYTLRVTNAQGCTSATASVTITVQPTAAAPVLSGRTTICAPTDTLVFTTTAVADSFYWIAPNGLIFASNSNTFRVPASNSAFYQSGNWTLRTRTLANPCQSLTSAPLAVLINSNGAAPQATNNGPVCIGGNVTLSTFGVTGATYRWYSDAALTNLIATTATPTINNITRDTIFYLTVQTSGCTSPAGSTLVRVVPQAAAPNIQAADTTVCAGDAIVLFTNTVASSYNWTGPAGFVSNLQNPAPRMPAIGIHSGIYRLNVTYANGCVSRDTAIRVVVSNIPATPVLSGNQNVCAGDSIRIVSNIVCHRNIWISPFGDTLVSNNGRIAIAANNRLYQAGNWQGICVDTVTGCVSAPRTYNINILSVPNAPVISNNPFVCVGTDATVSVSPQAGLSYLWYRDSLRTTIVGAQPDLTIFNVQRDTTVFIQSSNGNCVSAVTPVRVRVFNQTAAPQIAANTPVCQGNALILSTSTSALGYQWTGPNGFSSTSPTPAARNPVMLQDSGVYRLRTVDINGCFSRDTTIRVVVNAVPPTPTIAGNNSICFGDSIILTTNYSCSRALWINPAGDTLVRTNSLRLAVASNSPQYVAGLWRLVCQDAATSCGAVSNSFSVEIKQRPFISAFNGGPYCAGSDIQLTSSFIPNATYNWWADSNRTVLLANDRSTTVPNVTTNRTFYVEALLNGCVSNMDSTQVTIFANPITPAPSYFRICTFDTLFLRTNATAASYWWSGPLGFTSHLQNPIIPNTHPNNAGSYVVTITDVNGCQARSTVEVEIFPKPPTPTISHNAPFCVGTNLTLRTQPYYGVDVDFVWTRPNGVRDTTQVPNYVYNTTTLADTGLYQLFVIVDGCVSLPAEEVIRLYPIPARPNVPANFTVCEGDSIRLITTTDTTNVLNYYWTGPNGFSSNIPQPTIRNAVLGDSGVYRLFVENQFGCRSLDSATRVTVNPKPPVPTIFANSPLCFGDTLRISSGNTCGQSQWISPYGNGAAVLGTPSATNVLWHSGSSTSIPSTNSNYIGGNWYMICIDTVTGCRSRSNTIDIEIKPVPTRPAAFNNSPICAGQSVQLNTATVSGATYAWYADSLRTVLVATSANPTILNLTRDSTFYVDITVNGCRSALGSTRVTVRPRPAKPNVPANFAVCEGSPITLTTSTFTGVSAYQWTGVNGFNSTQRNPTVIMNASPVDSGDYFLRITDQFGCVSLDTMVTVGVNRRPTTPVLTSNSPICAGTNLILTSNLPAVSYIWTAPNSLDTASTANPLTVLPNSANFYRSGSWSLRTVNAAGCTSLVSNAHIVTIETLPSAPMIVSNSPVCRNSSAQLTTNFIANATYTWYGNAALTQVIGTSQNLTVNNLTADSTVYLQMARNGCTTTPVSFVIRVRPNPAAPNVPANFVVCEGDNIVLTSSTLTAQYIWNGVNGFNSNLQNPVAISNANAVHAGAYNLQVIDSFGCASPISSVTVTVNPKPSIAIASSNAPICAGQTLNLVASTSAVGATYQWFNAANGMAIGSGQTLSIPSVSISQAGNYYVVATLNGCNSGNSTPTNVIINDIPSTAAFAGTDIALCNQFTTNLSATMPSIGAGKWTTTGAAVIANPNMPNSAVYNLAAGQNTFIWTLSNGSCLDYSRDTMVVSVTPSSSDLANAGTDINVCGTTPVQLTATSPSISSGRWTQPVAQSSAGVTISNITASSPSISGLQGGRNYTFTWTLSNGNCVDYSTDQVNINVSASPPDNAFAGMDIRICNNNSTTLTALPSQYGTGRWTIANGGGLIIDPTQPATFVANLPSDTTRFVWTLSNGTCLNYSRDTMLVIVSSANDIAEAGAGQVLCSVNNISLSATVPSVGGGRWSQSAAQANQGVVIVNPTSATTQVTGLVGGSIYTFTWTLSNGSCINYSSDVTTINITNVPPDRAFAGNDINLCGTNVTSLQAASPAAATGRWTSTSTATIVNPVSPSSQITNLPMGQSVFVWTLSSGSCVNYDFDSVIINVTQPSNDVANAGRDSTYCNASTVTLNGNTPSAVGGVGTWTQTAAQAGTGVVISNVTANTPSVTGLTAGNLYTFTWTFSNGGCVNYSTDNVNIRIDALPNSAAFAGNDTVLCGGNAVRLRARQPLVGTGLWTTANIATIVNPNLDTTEVFNIQQDTSFYVWTLSNGVCRDYSADTVRVVLVQASTDIAFAGLDQTLCSSDSIQLNADVPLTSTGRWTQSSGQQSAGVFIVNPTAPNATVRNLRPGNSYTFTWTLSTAGCPNFSTDQVTYNINAIPQERAYAGLDTTLCNSSTFNLNAIAPQLGSGSWTTNSSAVIINPSDARSVVVNVPAGTSVFYWTLSNGVCQNFSSDSMVVISAPPTTDFANAGLDLNVCDSSTLTLNASPTTNSTGRWSQSVAQAGDSVTITNPNSPNAIIGNLRPNQSYVFMWSLSNSVCADFDVDTITVTVSRLPNDVANAGDDLVFCGTGSIFVEATTPSQGTGLWTSPTNATIITPTALRTEVLNLVNGENILIWSLTNGACRNYSVDTLFVTVDERPEANRDSFRVIYNNNGTNVNVVLNDSLTNNWSVSLVAPPANGIVTNNNDGSFGVVLTNFLGTETFTYTVCNTNCPAEFCDTTTVTLLIDGGLNCDVPNIFTPNQDGTNDALIIPCLSNYPNSKIVIFNRWGDVVYESDNYQNDWQGTFRNEPLPDGTYFYILTTSPQQVFQGFVELRR